MKMTLSHMVVAMIAASFITTAGFAGPSAHEGFDGYEVGADLSGKSGGSSFSGGWQMPGTGVTAKVVEGLSLGELPASGKAASFKRADAVNAKRYAFRPLNAAPGSKEIWMSYLAKWTKDNGGDGHSAEVGIGTYTHQDDANLNLFTSVLTVNESDKFSIGFNEAMTETTEESNSVGKTVLVVARWTGINTDDQEATIWVFDKAADVNAVLKASSTDTLDQRAFTKQSVKGTMDLFAEKFGLKVGGFIGGDPGSYEVTIDEIRVGSKSADVLPGSSIPKK